MADQLTGVTKTTARETGRGSTDRPAHPTFAEASLVWGRIGLMSFGGPAGQIALMHRELVDERRWISESRFLHALNFCMLLPGPEAQQLATYIGWLMHGWRGGVVAGTLFVLPGFLVILALSMAYVTFADTHWMSGLFFGLKAAVLAIVVEAVIRVGKRSLKNNLMRVIAALAFVALFAFAVPFPVVVLLAAITGYVGVWMAPDLFKANGHGAQKVADKPSVIDDAVAARAGRKHAWLSTLLVWGALWLAPFLIIAAFARGQGAYADIFSFFSQMAVVTFGGAYAVLSYVAQQAVGHYGWLAPGEMLDGLAMAETTPGPLVLVLTFTGFLAAYREPGLLMPMAGGIAGAVLTTWVTFIPCFLWIFLFAPVMERLRGYKALSGALSAISAAVTGVVLNLAVWFALHVLFAKVGEWKAGPLHLPVPDPASIQWLALGLTAVSVLLVFRLKWPMPATLALCGLAGLAGNLAGLA